MSQCKECINKGCRDRRAQRQLTPEKLERLRAVEEARQARYRERNLEQVRKRDAARARARRKANPEYYRHARRARMYGLSLENYHALWERQQGRCAICRIHESKLPPRRGHQTLAVDHDHDTGKVRGLLCDRCNSGLGQLGDTVRQLRRALAYLERQS